MSQLREIEVKYRVGDLAGLLAALAERGVELSAPIRQDDQAYAELGWQYGMGKLGRSFVRLRTVNGRHVFTLKRPQDNELACVEYESQVADREQMHGAITAMGFYPTTRVVKDRRSGRWGDLSVCVDEVDGVGVFFEVEKVIGPGESGTVVQDELDRVVRSLAVELERSTQTYDSLVRLAQTAVV